MDTLRRREIIHSRLEKLHNVLLAAFLIVGTNNLLSQKDEVLFYIENNPVSVSEFKYIYEKNNREKADYTQASIEEYLDLYINFKLKVQKAKDLGYHETDAYKQELSGYRKQLADSYIIDKEVYDKMIDQVYERQQYDLELSHILIPLSTNANTEALDDAFNRIQSVKEAIDKGIPFEQAVVRYSQDPNSASQGGNIGYVSAPLPDGYVVLENEAYSLEVGEISKPIKTNMGYHIVKLLSKRPARGRMTAEHILIRTVRNGIRLADGYRRIHSIHKEITSGAISFENAVIKYSDDRETKGQGGLIGTFGIGEYEKSFEDGAFDLKNNGDISEPVETSLGWHIIRRVSVNAPETREIIEYRIVNDPKRGERFQLIYDEVISSIKSESRFKANQETLYSFIAELDDTFFSYNWTYDNGSNDELISLGSDRYDLNAFVEFVKLNSKERMKAQGQYSIEQTVNKLYEEFIAVKALVYAENRLEDRHPDFKNLMREYREGILLFDITKDFVWDKASKDTSGVRQFFEKNRQDYMWEDRARITSYAIRTVEPPRITPILTAARTNAPEVVAEMFNTENELVTYKEELLEKKDKTLEGIVLEKGHVAEPQFHRNLNVTTFTKVEDVLPARLKTLKEARGYVISDYQDELDKMWVQELKNEYKVRIRKKTLKKLAR